MYFGKLHGETRQSQYYCSVLNHAAPSQGHIQDGGVVSIYKRQENHENLHCKMENFLHLFTSIYINPLNPPPGSISTNIKEPLAFHGVFPQNYNKLRKVQYS